jgi:cytochrome c-type biogenesis protein CcmH/NrfF
MSCTFKARPVHPHHYWKNRLLHDIPTLLLVIGTIGIMLRPRRKGEEPAAQNRRLDLLTHPQHKLAS